MRLCIYMPTLKRENMVSQTLVKWWEWWF